MKVLLVQPRYTYTKDMPLIIEMPLGLCYIAAVLREKGHTVEILDCLAEGYSIKEVSGDRITYGLPDTIITQRIQAFRPKVIGCAALFSVFYENVRQLCNLVKKIDPDIITVVGGIHPTVKSKEVLTEKAVDFILQGEADYTFSELIDALENNKDYSGIDGIGYKNNGNVRINKKEKFIENLDELPFPARDLLKIDCYFQAGLAHGYVLKHKRNANLITSRGCSARCIFCADHLIWGRRFRARSPENVLAELEHLKKCYKIKHVQFEDDNLTYDINRAKKIFQGMIERKLNLKWNTPNGVALWRMDKETLALMKKSGCYYVKFAVESGSQRVLSEVIKKPQNLKQVTPLINYARSIGLKTGSFFVVGFPGETKEEMQVSFDFAHKVKLDYIVYSIATPHYGTELRKICEQNNYLKEHSNADLYIGRGLIDTPDFSSEWIEQKVMKEHQRYIKHLALHQLETLLTQGWQIFKRHPFFVIEYMRKIFRSNEREKGKEVVLG